MNKKIDATQELDELLKKLEEAENDFKDKVKGIENIQLEVVKEDSEEDQEEIVE